jgi:hypothetical protein
MENQGTQIEWLNFKAEYYLAEGYLIPHQLSGSNTGRNPIVDHLLPSLLFVNCMGVFDAALIEYEERNQLVHPKKFPHTLGGRIELFSELGLLANAAAVNEARKLRNKIAHEIKTRISWSDLKGQIAIIETEIIKLGFIFGPVIFEAYGERSGIRD